MAAESPDHHFSSPSNLNYLRVLIDLAAGVQGVAKDLGKVLLGDFLVGGTLFGVQLGMVGWDDA